MWIWIYMRISCESPHHLWVLHFRLSHCGYCTESHVCMSWYVHTYICAYVCMYRLYHLQLWSAKVHVALCIIVWLCNICMYLVIILCTYVVMCEMYSQWKWKVCKVLQPAPNTRKRGCGGWYRVSLTVKPVPGDDWVLNGLSSQPLASSPSFASWLEAGYSI